MLLRYDPINTVMTCVSETTLAVMTLANETVSIGMTRAVRLSVLLHYDPISTVMTRVGEIISDVTL